MSIKYWWGLAAFHLVVWRAFNVYGGNERSQGGLPSPTTYAKKVLLPILYTQNINTVFYI